LLYPYIQAHGPRIFSNVELYFTWFKIHLDFNVRSTSGKYGVFRLELDLEFKLLDQIQTGTVILAGDLNHIFDKIDRRSNNKKAKSNLNE
jgi:hypothetical protein